jgi:predicted RNA-binding Zn-ribbon protein involved in translation (DUF1610 family)
MTQAPVELIPLLCTRCQTPVPAQPDEVAWVCAQCGQGLLLDDQKGTLTLEIHYSAGLNPTGQGWPFWVAHATVELERRLVFGGGDQSDQTRQFWGGGRTFFIPAFTCPLDQLVGTSGSLVTQPPALQAGPAAPFRPITMLPEDILPYAEFVFLSLEAGRKDRLKEVQFKLHLAEPELWILP